MVEALDISAGGFYTEEVRSGGRRWGFGLITLDGRRVTLASADSGSPYRVSKYGVELAALDEAGAPAIEEAIASAQLIVVDEIGKMELFSQRFRRAVLAALDSGKPLLASIMLGPHPFADAVKGRPDVELVVLSETNRIQTAARVLSDLKRLLAIDRP